MSLAHVVLLQIQNVRFSELRQQQPYTYTQLIYVSYCSHASDRIGQLSARARSPPSPPAPSSQITRRSVTSHAARFSFLIWLRARVNDCGIRWCLNSPSRKLISPPSRIAKPER